jgi:hypothetical protein
MYSVLLMDAAVTDSGPKKMSQREEPIPFRGAPDGGAKAYS